MYKFFISLTLGAMLLGCSNEPQNTQTAGQQIAEQPTSQTVPNTPTKQTLETNAYVSPLPDDAPEYKVATEANYAPYEFKDEEGKLTGFDIDLIRAIGEKQGFKVNIINDPWQEIFIGLEQNKRDIVAAGLTATEERQAKYGLSNSYSYALSAVAYISDDFSIQSLDDLAGKKVGVLVDSAPFDFFSKSKIATAELREYDTVFLAIRGMLRGEVDVVAGDSAVMHYTMGKLQKNNHFTSKFFEYEKSLSEDTTGTVYAVRKEDTELLQQLNQGIDAVVADGTYAKIAEKWLGKSASDKFLEQHTQANK